MDSASTPWWFLEGETPKHAPEPKEHPAPDLTKERKRRRKILCRRCREELSDSSAVFAMSACGASQVFLNPHGFVHEVTTVRWVVNVTVAGPPTTDFTWYPGYAWETAWCGRCGGHLGWSFTAVAAAEPGAFWALRRDSIAESGPTA